MLREKYKATTLNDCVFANQTIQNRIQAYASGNLKGHLILHGPNGTGKSTIADLLPYAIDGQDAYIEPKDFDDLINVKDLRNYLENGYFYWGKTYLVFHEFDDAKGSFSLFCKTIDKLQNKVMMIITTNNPMKIHQSIRSRCNCISLPALTATDVLPRIQFILRAEGIHLPDIQVLAYLKSWDKHGDIRKYLDVVADLTYLHKSNLPFPLVTTSRPKPAALKVVNKNT